MELQKKLAHQLLLLTIFLLHLAFQKSLAQAPTVLPAEMVGNMNFNVVWHSYLGTTNYEIDVATNPAFTENLKVFNVNTNNAAPDNQYFGSDRHLSKSGDTFSYTVTQLSPSMKYYYRVRIVVPAMDPPYSSVIEVSTEPHPAQISSLSWVTTINNPSGVAEVQSMVGDDDGNIYAAGHYSNTIVAGTKTLTSKGGDDMFILKLNPNGEITWAQSIGGIGNDGEASLALDSSGLYVVGIFVNSIDVDPGPGIKTLTNVGLNQSDGFYAKLKPSDGTLIWAGQLVDALTWSPASIKLDTTGLYISGFFYDTSNLGTVNSQFISNGHEDIFFGKYDLKDGKAIWAKSIGGANYDGVRAMDVEAGALYITGFFNGDGDWNTGTINDNVDFDPGSNIMNLSPGGGFLAKYSAVDGSLVFAKAFTGTSNSMCNPWTIDVDKSSIYISGFYHGVINFDAVSNTTHTAEDIGGFIGRYKTSDGNAHWVKNLKVTRFIHPRRIMADNAGFYLSGGFDASVNFDPAESNAGNRGAIIGYDNFIARYAPDGTFAWVKTLDVVSIAPAARTSDGYFLGGMFWKSVNFDPYHGSSIKTPNGNGMFVAKYQAVSPPFAPALRIASVDTVSISTTWNSMAGATSYSVDLSTDNFNTILPGHNSVNVTTEGTTFTGLNPHVTYYSRVRSVNTFGSSDDSQVIKVETSCPAKPSITTDTTDPSNPILTSSSLSGNQWFLDGVAIANANGKSFTVSQTGSYTVQVTTAGCKSKMSDMKVITVTGLNSVSRENNILQIFPNPAKETVSIRLEDFVRGQGVTIEVFDLMGRKMKTEQVSDGNLIILDVSTFNKGVFLVKALLQGKHYLFRLVKQ